MHFLRSSSPDSRETSPRSRSGGRAFRPEAGEIIREELRGNDLAQIPPLARRLVQKARHRGIVNDRGALQLQMSLEEALTNAVIHGNLEVPSTLQDLPDLQTFRRTIDQRRQTSPYSSRVVRIEAVYLSFSVRFRVEDEGPGFDPATLRDPALPENQERSHGRGIAMMRCFMDRVCFNARGNAVIMTKRRKPILTLPGSEGPDEARGRVPDSRPCPS